MRRLVIPNTGLETSRLGFGAASLHHVYSATDRRTLLAAVFEAGICHFDTARMYGEGLAEHALGQFFSGSLRRQVTLATKFGFPANPLAERFTACMYVQKAISGMARRLGRQTTVARARDLSLPGAEASLARSLKALRTDWLDVLFVHEPQPDEVSRIEALAEWLLRIKTNGMVRCVGLAGRAAICIAIARTIEGVFDVLQVEDSVAGCEADALTEQGWPLQVTYGYFRRAAEQAADGEVPDAETLFRQALARNPNGTILVSSRRPDRIRHLARISEQAGE